MGRNTQEVYDESMGNRVFTDASDLNMRIKHAESLLNSITKDPNLDQNFEWN